MKINKILAAGVAATLAVTSLSAVASAEIKTLSWKMDYTYSKVQWNGLRMQWLDDNDYITSGLGSYTVAATNLEAAIGADDVDGTIAKAIADGATMGKDADGNPIKVALTGDKKLSEFLTSDASTFIDDDVDGGFTDILAAALAYLTGDTGAKALAAAGKEVSALQIQNNKEAVGAVNSAIDLYKKAIAYVETVRKAVIAEEANAELIKDINSEAAKLTAGLQGIITKCAAAVTGWNADIEGPKLLSETEVGGIYLKKTPVKVVMKDKKTYYAKPTAAKLTIKGTKRGSTANETFSTDFKKAYKNYKPNLLGDEEDTDYLFVAFAPKYVNREGFINLNVFGTITDASIDVSYTLYDDEDCKVETWKYTQVEYDDVKEVGMLTLRNGLDLDYIDTIVATAGDVDTWTPETKLDDKKTSRLTKDVDSLVDHSTALYKLFYGLDKSVVDGNKTENSSSQTTLQPFLKMTTDTEGQTIVRNRVRILSVTGDHTSATSNGKSDVYFDGATQTYDDFGMGTQPKWFAGLASQCADFFTKQNNGQIIFKFKDPALADKWVSYGVPSTEVGLRTLQGTAMALFFNYETSTGSIQTIGVVDKDAWTITFDIATVLEDFNYSTKANLHDIYYGLNTGVDYGAPYSAKGYVVETVTLQYDDAPAAVDASTDDDAAVVVADDDDDDVVADDDDDDIFEDDDVVADDDDDDDDAGIIEDDDDDDTDVNNDVDYVDGADDDANPGTGVGLAVIPAIVAAAAAIVSKKRK